MKFKTTTMKKLFILLTLISTLIYSQSKNNNKCNALLAKGYTKDFCSFDNRYSFKEIPFESSYEYVSKIFELKSTSELNVYDTYDFKFINWAGVQFDYGKFYFSENDKLDAIGLSIYFEATETDRVKEIIENSQKLKKIKTILLGTFGKDKKKVKIDANNDSLIWYGNKMKIIFVYEMDKGIGQVYISRLNRNVLDEL